MRKQKGFTLIELLVVIAIIGLLSTLAVVSLNSARAKARDARRVTDIKQVQTALELYYNDNEAYPTQALNLGIDGTSDCLENSATAFTTSCDGSTTVYMPNVPAPPQSGETYVYESLVGDVNDYTIIFSLEGDVRGVGDAGDECTAGPSGQLNCTAPTP